jgi:hypothetical protein
MAARADEQRCTGVIADWQPRSALVKMAEDMGWTVSRIRADDGCYTIRGRNKDGREIRARVDPVSLKVLSTREGRRHHDDDDEDEGRGNDRRDDRRGERRQAPTESRAPATENPLMKGKPQSQIQ